MTHYRHGEQHGGENVARFRHRIDDSLALICERFAAQSPPLGAAMSSAVLAPGKRFRGTLVLLAGSATGGVCQTIVDIACALELVHTASLVFDDLPCMDNSLTRRGQATTHAAHGESRAILAGIALVTEALGLLAAGGAEPATRARLVSILAAALGPAGLCAGQDMDLHAAKSPARLAREHDLKTGALFAAGFEMLAAFRGLPALEVEGLARLGMLLGRAFQSYDDLLDLAEDGIAAAGRADPGLSVPAEALERYMHRRGAFYSALSACPFDGESLARFTATVLPAAVPRAA